MMEKEMAITGKDWLISDFCNLSIEEKKRGFSRVLVGFLNEVLFKGVRFSAIRADCGVTLKLHSDFVLCSTILKTYTKGHNILLLWLFYL